MGRRFFDPERREFRHAVYAAILRRYEDSYGNESMQSGACLYWTLAGLEVFRALGYRALLQAGSMSWPILPVYLDDGQIPTHFSYKWSPWTKASRAALSRGQLPEIHIWIGLPDQGEIVDFSTKWFPHQAKRLGLVWRMPAPPDFLWAPIANLPPGVIYKPNLEAIAFVLQLISARN